MDSHTTRVKAAVVQAEPVWFNLGKTVEKASRLITEAAAKGAHIVAFPELWIPGYPTWIWARPTDFAMSVEYANNSLALNSPEMRTIQSCAAENGIVVCLGYSERRQTGLYIAQCTIGSDGKLLMSRRKLRPVHVERTVFGDGDGPSLENVVETAAGRVGQLSCGEHYNPLFNFNTLSQREQIHVAAWPVVVPHSGGPDPYSMSAEAVGAISRVYSVQAQCFTLHATSVIASRSIEIMRTGDAPVFNVPGGGNSKIFAPNGRQLSDDLEPTKEGLIFVDLDFDIITLAKGLIDSCGRNSRPELVWLGRNPAEQEVVRSV